jgi:hypothetical protein
VSGHPMDDRREYRHGTLIYSDRYGPRELWRGGVQVSCVCDPAHGLTCAYHGRQQEQAPPARKPSRLEQVAGHLVAGDLARQAGQAEQARQHYLAALRLAKRAQRPAIQEAIAQLDRETR